MHYLAFLRGINLGRRRLKMEKLRALFEALKFRQVTTFIASGNVAFESAARDESKLTAQIERHLQKELGYEVDTFLRTREELARIVDDQPFAKEIDGQDSSTVHVGFFREALPSAIARKLEAVRTETDAFRVRGREYYWLCHTRISESEVWTLPAMREFRLPASSMRNLKTLRKMAALYPPKST